MATDPIAQRFAPRRIALLLAGIVILGWLTWSRSGLFGGGPASLTTFTGPTMGTSFTIKVVQQGSAVPDDELQAIVERQLGRVNEWMSTYVADSEISRFNASRSTEPFPISPETAAVLACALKVSEQTMGAFDVTLGPIVNAYGFGPPGRGEYPTDETIEALREHVGYDKLEFDPVAPSLRKLDPEMYVDLNAIAPGYASDLIAAAFDAAGVVDYMIEVGGEVRARGHNAEGEAWRVGIEKPAGGERSVQRVVPLDGLALATSGDYRDYFEENGVRISHTIDGRTGRPIAHNLASVSIIHEQCMWADAYSTAIMALGPDDGYLMAEILKLPALFILRGDDGFTERATPAFEELFGSINEPMKTAP
jgi:thiamine biosynthesis lipoprotein